MAKKERVLACLHTLESELTQVINSDNREMWIAVMRNMAITKNMCLQGLPESVHIKYDKLYDKMMLAFKEMAESDKAKIKKHAFSQCGELIKRLIHKTEQETKFKKDVIFLPYKAAMWDSLESVWKAAFTDKDRCNAYVIPIPYAERNPNGSVAAWRCDREEFPKDVPTLDWQKVDLKAWHPDVIVYHNPYDDINFITSVEGRYYSRNLKACADKLIYIPYFILSEPYTEESVQHFATVPGVFNADKVVVQSEKMRQLYIDVLTKRTKQKDRAYWEAHILGIGSPKIEKVITSKKEDFELPEKWRKLIEGKKVVLYNTSVGATLTYADKVCDKLRSVFKFFKNCDDAVLWWRPHPLMKSTFHSAKPQYEAEYLALEKEYIEEGFGIYDDSPDLHRAICYSDAYYGDGSSVVGLYQYTGKPMLMQDIYSVGMYMDTLSIMGRCSIVDGDDLWIFSFYTNCLLRFSLQTERLEEYYPFPENPWVNNASLALAKAGRYFYFAPCNERNCWRFDTISKKFEVVDIGLTYEEKDMQDKFRSAVILDGKLYMFGWNFPAIVVLDLASGRHERIDGWISDLNAAGIETSGTFINLFYAVGEHTIYAPVQNGPYVLSLNTKTNEYSLKKISEDGSERFCAVYYKAEKLYITNNKDDTIVWDLKCDMVTRQNNNFLSGQVIEYRCIFVEDNITVYVPATFSFIGYKTSKDESFRKITLPLNLLKEYPDGVFWKYSFGVLVDGILYLQAVRDGKVYAVNFTDESVRECDFSPSEQFLSVIRNRKKQIFFGENQLPLAENDVLSLDAFLDADVQTKVGLSQVQNRSVGEEIYYSCIL